MNDDSFREDAFVELPPGRLELILRAHSPRVTYILLGITIFFYVLQWISPLFFGYAPLGLDWLEYFGAR
ncbi:MAG: hypothetical protein ACK8QZ_00180, partial [Anaerolineales bacterium]